MKLSSLTPEQKIRLLAELDGRECPQPFVMLYEDWLRTLPDYNTSYDAIIPLVQKLFTAHDFRKFDIALGLVRLGFNSPPVCSFNTLKATPSQLCDAVLVALPEKLNYVKIYDKRQT